MKWVISGQKGGVPGRWALEASSEESARRKADRAGVVIEQITVDGQAGEPSPETVAAPQQDTPAAEPACANCGRTKGRLEQLYEWGEHAVCLPCYNVLSASVGTESEPQIEQPQQVPQTIAYAATAPVYYAAQTPRISGLGIASLVLGILGLAMICIPFVSTLLSLVGLVLGFVAYVIADRNAPKGMIIAGLILSGLPFILGLLMLFGLFTIGAAGAAGHR